MAKITLDAGFWAVATMTAYELFEYRNAQGVKESAECLGRVWGVRTGDQYTARYATVTQLIKERTKDFVIGPNSLSHALHDVWAAQVAFGCALLGGFHSHPWNEAEIRARLDAGSTEDSLHQASDEDRDAMWEPSIEIILSCRSLVNAPSLRRPWGEQGLVAAGEFDLAHITISGWLKDESGQVTQIQVELPSAAAINTRIASMSR